MPGFQHAALVITTPWMDGVALDRVQDECLHRGRSLGEGLMRPLAGPEQAVEAVDAQPAAAVMSKLRGLVRQQAAGSFPAPRIRHRTGEGGIWCGRHRQDGHDLAAPGHVLRAASPRNGLGGGLDPGKPSRSLLLAQTGSHLAVEDNSMHQRQLVKRLADLVIIAATRRSGIVEQHHLDLGYHLRVGWAEDDIGWAAARSAPAAFQVTLQACALRQRGDLQLDERVSPCFRPEVSLQHPADAAEAVHVLEQFQAQAKFQQVRERLEVTSRVDKLRWNGLTASMARQPIPAKMMLCGAQRPAPRISPRLRAGTALHPRVQSLPRARPSYSTDSRLPDRNAPLRRFWVGCMSGVLLYYPFPP